MPKCQIAGCMNDAVWVYRGADIYTAGGKVYATFKFETLWGSTDVDREVTGVVEEEAADIHLCDEHKEEIAEDAIDKLQTSYLEESPYPATRSEATGGVPFRELAEAEALEDIADAVHSEFEKIGGEEDLGLEEVKEELKKAIEAALLRLIIEKFGRGQ